MKTNNFLLVTVIFFLAACSSNSQTKTDTVTAKDATASQTLAKDSLDKIENSPVADANAILAKRQVPVLCYHHIREPKPGQSETFKSYSVSPSQFAQQMKALKDSGYETVLPNQLYDYLVHGAKLPPKPVMLTFDDTDEEQYSIGWTEMQKYGFKGVYFIMTISINRPRYMSKEQLKDLADKGNAVESHTWDHHMVTKYQGEDWDKQFVKPRKTIEDITGKPATYFAYPFGLWNQAAIPELKKAGFKMAFILSTKRDSTEPLYTIRRMIVPGQWSATGMIKAMKQTFKLD
ncbi:MAG: polysaccharide deacetylase family protein [Ginsengibacter sp.]|jgi:peptidoglycan/xylan/chitin deacetylase (PgdA/CDA1 family)